MFSEVEGVSLRLGLPARIFATMLMIFPGKVGDRMWRWWYQRLAKAKAWGDFGFMNYGFIDEDQPVLEPEDESDRLFIQLYHMNIRDVELSGKQVLEVGSGRGGGAHWVARTYAPKRLTALDYSAAAVKLCTRMYGRQQNLEFVEGNAMKLPFEDNSFDVLYNVESSHCYSDMAAFIHEAFRVLRPGDILPGLILETRNECRKFVRHSTQPNSPLSNMQTSLQKSSLPSMNSVMTNNLESRKALVESSVAVLRRLQASAEHLCTNHSRMVTFAITDTF